MIPFSQGLKITHYGGDLQPINKNTILSQKYLSGH